jgi:hypothetical protein
VWDVTNRSADDRPTARSGERGATAPQDPQSVVDKDSMGQRREARLGTVDRRHWHCMEETNAPPYEGIG